MKSIFLSLGILLILGACNGDSREPSPSIQWNPLGLEGHIVNQVELVQDKIFAATDQGFYVHMRNSGSQNWNLLGFENQSCQSFLILSENEFIVSLVNPQDLSQSALFKTTDGGQNWIDFTNGFGGEEGVEPVNDIVRHPQNPNVFYATGQNVIARSGDRGLSWKPIYGDWQGFSSGIDVIKVNPHDADQIWAGGQNAIEQGFVLFSDDGGINWNQWLNLVEAPSVAKEIIFHPIRTDEVYIGFEGGYIMTPNNGGNWETLIDSEENRFFFGLGISETDFKVFYAAGWLKRFDEPQPLILFRSENEGVSWQEHTFDGEAFGGVLDMKLISEGGKDKLYIGLYKGGVYEVVVD